MLVLCRENKEHITDSHTNDSLYKEAQAKTAPHHIFIYVHTGKREGHKREEQAGTLKLAMRERQNVSNSSGRETMQCP